MHEKRGVIKTQRHSWGKIFEGYYEFATKSEGRVKGLNFTLITKEGRWANSKGGTKKKGGKKMKLKIRGKGTWVFLPERQGEGSTKWGKGEDERRTRGNLGTPATLIL